MKRIAILTLCGAALLASVAVNKKASIHGKAPLGKPTLDACCDAPPPECPPLPLEFCGKGEEDSLPKSRG